MPAPEGNKYAEKYTEQDVEKVFIDSLEHLEADRTITFIGTLAVAVDLYRDWYTKMIERFPENQVLRTTKKKIEAVIESRVVEGAMAGKFNTAFSIFHLKNNYGWKDQQQIDVNGNVNLNINPANGSEPINPDQQSDSGV